MRILNLNETIRVKLFDKGYQHLADNHNSFADKIRNWEIRNADYYRNNAKEDGYTEFHAWIFIQEFGDVTHLGMVGYYDINIQIPETSIKTA